MGFFVVFTWLVMCFSTIVSSFHPSLPRFLRFHAAAPTRLDQERPFDCLIRCGGGSGVGSIGRLSESVALCLFHRTSLPFSYRQRQRLVRRMVWARQRSLQTCRNFAHGVAQVIGNYHLFFISAIIAKIFSNLLFFFGTAESSFFYQAYWKVLKSLLLVSEVYVIATESCLLFVEFSLLLIALVPLFTALIVLPKRFISVIAKLLIRNLEKVVNATEQLSSKQFGYATTCLFAPLNEEIVFRWLPTLVLAGLCRRQKKNNRRGQQDGGFTQRLFTFTSIMFGAAHIKNHIELGDKMADVPLSTVQSASHQAVSSFLFAVFTLVPAFQRHGLAAATGAHVTWNTLVTFGNRNFIGFSIMASALIRLGYSMMPGRSLPDD